ncbi:hypothetical protein AAG570_012799 [Ranatra chinensis]|uniref:Uncharacterized protein n=1 Tax=Ranatra chinensis TaxID=642074 RepID=A0ABD0YEW2_9HEMI
MASKRQNMFYQSKKRQTTEIVIIIFSLVLNKVRSKLKIDPQQKLEGSSTSHKKATMTKAFKCQISKQTILAKDANTKNDDWYDITDPRNSVNKRRREDSKQILNSTTV